MAKSELYKISGHWDHYRDGMFVLGDEEKDKEVFFGNEAAIANCNGIDRSTGSSGAG